MDWSPDKHSSEQSPVEEEVAESAMIAERIAQLDIAAVPPGFRMPRPEDLLGKPKHWINFIPLEADDHEDDRQDLSITVESTAESSNPHGNPHGVNKIPLSRSSDPVADPKAEEDEAESASQSQQPAETTGAASSAAEPTV